MTLIATALALALPTAADPLVANYHPDPCDRECRREVREARRQVRWERRRRRLVAPYRAWLASVRACETRGQPAPYQTNTGNGFFGAYQFTLSSWYAVGGQGYPHLAEPLEQDYRAVKLLLASGPGNWPVCG